MKDRAAREGARSVMAVHKRGGRFAHWAAALLWASLLSLLVAAQTSNRVLGAGGSDAAAASDAATAREGRLRVFDEVWEMVRARYYDPALRGVDWGVQRERFRQLAEKADGEVELYAALRGLLLQLHDPHTRVFPPGESTDWRFQKTISVGLVAREVEGELLVASVERESEAALAGVRAGDVVLKVDGTPVSTVVARRVAERAIAGEAATARALAVARLFDGPRDSVASVVLRGAGGRSERTVKLRRFVRVRAPELEARIEGRGVAVVRFNVFTQTTATDFVRAMRTELKEARGVVVDLRENGGGETEAMTDIASMFLPAGTRLGRFTDREGNVRIEPATRTRLVSLADQPPSYEGPIVVLTGARTASASEVFTAALRERGRAKVVGEATCGCVLGIRRRHTLPDGGLLDISEMDYRTALGHRLEGAGLVPDERVTPTRRDIQNGRDPALARALAILKTAQGQIRSYESVVGSRN